ncbi:hypothetical protein [Glycomyces sp. NPDC048151]|uniref:hypothetical protein n=1 Tax=Glycomyces sp. NPDC048151 TaxID=3364002 RepID=UPI003721E937
MTAPSSTGRLVRAFIGQGLLALLALTALAVGFAVQDMADGGALDYETGAYDVDSYAAVGDSWDESNYTGLGLIDAIRIEVDPATDQEVFAGFATPEGAQAFLDGVDHTLIHRATDAGGPTTEAVPGDAPTTLPGEADIWTAQTTGSGVQTLELDTENLEGEYVPIVMNADGSPAVAGEVTVYFDIPSLPWIIGAVYGVGLVLLALTAFLATRAVRRHRTAR